MKKHVDICSTDFDNQHRYILHYLNRCALSLSHKGLILTLLPRWCAGPRPWLVTDFVVPFITYVACVVKISKINYLRFLVCGVHTKVLRLVCISSAVSGVCQGYHCDTALLWGKGFRRTESPLFHCVLCRNEYPEWASAVCQQSKLPGGTMDQNWSGAI